MSIKAKFYKTLFLLTVSLQLLAQIPKAPVSIRSPNAASLGSHGEIPVSLFTGKPDISLNLHTLTDGDVQIPISLNYDASGVRPDVRPGWTGLNFNLSTQYAVSRTIKGVPDDWISAGFSNTPPHGGTIGLINLANSPLNTATWDTESTMKSLANDARVYDMQPDEYSFNIPGLSGKFYYGQDNTWKVACDRLVTVSLIGNSLNTYPPFAPPVMANGIESPYYQPHMAGFLIRDEFGTEYEFGGGNNSYMEYSMPFFKQRFDPWFCNAWYLKSITRATGQKINFVYERGPMVAQMNFSVSDVATSEASGPFFTPTCTQYSGSVLDAYTMFSGSLISPIYLKSISSSNFTVQFESTNSTQLKYDIEIFSNYVNQWLFDNRSSGVTTVDLLPYLYDCMYSAPPNNVCSEANPPASLNQLLNRLQWRKLDRILIQDGAGLIVKKFELEYNNVSSERLMLQKVQEKSAANVALPPYEFTYFNDFPLPKYLKSHNDHWGYYNGKIINLSDFSSVATYGDTYRSPAADKKLYLQGSLKMVKYPTGGFTKYWFEPHTYAKVVKPKRWEGLDPFTTNQVAGGLRIKEIHNYDGIAVNPTTIKKYYYVTGFNPSSPDTTSLLSSGVLGGLAKYWWPDYKPKPEGNYTFSQKVFSVHSVLPASENSMGSHVGYSQVVEKNSSSGWSVYSFTNFDNGTNSDNGYLDSAPSGFLQESTTPYEPYTSNAFMRGRPIYTKLFSENGNIASKVEYEYNLLGQLQNNSARSFKSMLTQLCSSGHLLYEGTAYLIDVRKFLPVSELTYTYDSNDAFKYTLSSRITAYKPNGQVRAIYTTDSKTSITKVQLDGIGSVYDRQKEISYKYPDEYTGSPYSNMTLKNMIGSPIEITTKMLKANPNINDFDKTLLKWEKISYKSVGIAANPNNYDTYLPEKVESTLGSATTSSTDVEFLTYDLRGNLTSFKEKNGSTTKLEYYGTTDIGKTDLVKKRTSADGTAMAQSTSYDYKPVVGVEKITDPSGKESYYVYDDFNRLTEIREGSITGNLIQSFHYKYSASGQIGTVISPNPNVIEPSSPEVPVKYSRILIVGNSITKLIAQSGTDGWRSDALIAEGGWGRASSTKDKDFVHILEKRFRDINRGAQVLPLWEAPFERDYNSGGIAGWLTYNYTDLQNRIISGFGGPGNKPDLIIIRLGENVNNDHVNPQNFKEAFKTLIDKILAVSTPGAKVIVTNSMWPDQPLANTKIQEVATERSLPFVDLSDMTSNCVYLAGHDPVSMAAFPNNTGDTHPGDAGMLEIADRIWSKVTNVDLASNIGGNVSKVRFYPRTDCCMDHIVGSVIQGSNDISNANGWTTLATINEVPSAGWNEYFIRTTTAWRYLRFLAGPNSSGELIELEFYNGNTKITGATFGSAGYGVVFDGQMINFWQGAAPGSQNYAGLDLSAGCTCSALTASVLSPANNASVVGTFSTTTANRVTTDISVTTCLPVGSIISSVEIWATTIDGGFPNRMGYAVPDAGQPGVYKLSSVEGSANGQWPIPYLGPGTYRFYAIVKTATSTVTTDYVTVTLTAPPVTGCPVLTASVLSPANNASVVGTASTTTANRVTTAISVMTCVPTGSTINSVEIWATTVDGGFPNRMGYAVADAGQPGVYKLSSVEGSANGQWPIPYLGPGTYRFYAIVKTATSTVTTDYITVTLTAPPVTGCPVLTASVLSPANNASVVGTASTTTADRVTTAISVMTCVPAGSTISSVEIWAATSDGGWPNRMGYAVADASQPGVYKLSSVEGSANGQWPTPYLGPGTYRFYAVVNTGTASVTTDYITVTLTAPAVTGCPVLTASVLSPANNASVVGTASTTTADRVTTAISVTTCVPTGSTINSVEIWAATSDGGWPNRMGYAVADVSQPGVYKLSSVEGSANGQWPTPYLGPGTYRFYAVVNTGTTSVTTDYITVTLTAPPVTGCPVLTASVLSPANNASVVGTASTTTADRVTTAISVTTCIPAGSTISSVEIWAATSDGGWPNRMGYAIADASQPGVYKLSSVEGSANGQWPTPYLGPGTYRFYAVVNTGTASFTTGYNTITLTAPAGTSCPALTGSVLSPVNNASVVGTASTTTADRVTTAISVMTCVPAGSTISSVEIWAATSDGGWPNRMGYAIADASQPGVYKLSSVEGSPNGQWPTPYLGPGTYRFYAIVNTGTASFTTGYNTITLTAPAGTSCPALTGSVLSPANNASVVGTASTTTANRVTTAISVTTCVPAGSIISSVEVWAATSDGGWPNRMGYAVADASQPGVYKLSSVEGSANGQWPTPYLGPGTYRFYAIVNTGTASFTTGYNTITLTAP